MFADKLTKLFPKSQIDDFVPFWDEITEAAGIDTPGRLLMFLANTYHETRGFTSFIEDLRYDAQGLANTWPNRYAKNPDAKKHNKKAVFIPNELAISLHRKPEAIANTTYANRMGNRGVASGDGWRFRGRSLPMITGAGLYVELDIEFRLDKQLINNPDIILDPQWGLKAAGYFWESRNMNKYADIGDVKGGRKKWNGGLIGFTDVQKLYNEFAKLLYNA